MSNLYDDAMNQLASTRTVPDVAATMPDYMQASDAHNYMNGTFAVTDPSTWTTGAGNAIKFSVSAIASGLNSFYNSGVTVSNWLGNDAEQNDIATQLGSFDDDLGKYYKENRESVDTAGFVVASFIPGLGGIKLLNMGQKALRVAQETGIVGSNLSRVTGLLAPSVDAYKTLAAADIASSSMAYNTLTANTLKAIGAGYGQAALESAAFEIAVQATSFRSPTLSDADGWDIAKNIATGALVGGVIGGAINHATTGYGIRKAAKSFNPLEKEFSDTTNLTGLSPAQSIIARQERLMNIPGVPTAEQLASGDIQGIESLMKGLPAAEQAGVAGQLSNKLSRVKSETENTLQLANRKDMQAMATGGDTETANAVADMAHGLDANQSLANFHNLEEIGRISTPLKAEKIIATESRNQINALSKDIEAEITPTSKSIAYIKMYGEDAGKVSTDIPKVLSIADTATSTKAVQAKISSYGFKTSSVWDAAADDVTHTEAEARYLWADKIELLDGAKIGAQDIPLLERARELGLVKVNIAGIDAKSSFTLDSAKAIDKYLQDTKQSLGNVLQDTKQLTNEEIAKITNTSQSFWEGEVSQTNPTADMFARQEAKAQYMKDMDAKGLVTNSNREATADQFGYTPTYFKAAYSTKEIMGADGNLLSGMAYVKGQQKQYQEGIDNVFAKHATDNATQFSVPSEDMLLGASRQGSGPGLFRFSNGSYGSIESWTEQTGAATARLQKTIKTDTSETLESHVYNLASNQEHAIEFETINKHVAASPELMGLREDGSGLSPLKILDYEAAITAGQKATYPVLREGAQKFIPIQNGEVLAAWKARTQLTGDRTTALGEMRNAQGLEDIKDPRAMRPIRPDPRDYPFFAIVKDDSVTATGHSSMIHAASEKELDAMISKVPDNYSVYKKNQMEAYHKAYGDFDYERTLHENYINGDLRSNGINNPFFIKTDPQKIAQDFLADHLKSDDIFTRELVNAKYEKEFGFFRQQGEQFTSSAASKYTGSYQSVESSVNNPYTNYIKTALNLSQVGEHPYIMGLNNALDKAYSKVHDTIGDAFGKVTKPADLDKVNDLLSKYGVSSGYRDAATELLANHSAPKGELVKFVGRANSILTTLVTRMDPLNAVNNAIGSTILTGTELNSVVSAIKKGNSDVAGGLAAISDLTSTPVPSAWMTSGEQAAKQALASGAIDSTINQGKLVQQAVKNFMDKESMSVAGHSLHDWYKENGFTSRLTDQFHQVMENLTLTGTETPTILGGKIQQAISLAKGLAEKGEVWSGNKLAEEFNRFTAVDCMRQITDIGLARGAITESDQLAYMNTFLNRTQGNTLASQRPLMFQGAVGQAIGLFQSYQFNMMQQLFRHVGEGTAKDSAMLLGLQGTMYGMNGLPAFNYLNTHIVGTMSNNPQHKDLYTTTYGIAGKSVGDMLLYGIPSDMLRGNLYSRGDINPRSLTVIPTNPLDIPFVNATIKLYDNVKGALTKTAQGGNIWESMLQGIEHNGLSRPLAGIAQAAQAFGNGGEVYSTTGKGSIGSANDLLSWATAVRLAGGKPLNEAIANDATFRISSYQLSDKAKVDQLNSSIRSTLIAGNQPTDEQVGKFAQEYAALGGKQINFNKHMMDQFKVANTNQANKIMEALKNPQSANMQTIMGGTELLDGRSVSQ